MADRRTVVFCWGNMTHGQLGLGGIEEEQICAPHELSVLSDKSVKDIACGIEHTLFLLNGGIAYSCGNDDYGQLGHSKAHRKPEMISALEMQVVSLVACGSLHSVAVNEGGHLFTWGSNQYQQLGRPTTDDLTAHPPKLVKELSHYNIIQVACGYQHTLALTDDGRLYTWGSNSNGQLGIVLPSTAVPANSSCRGCSSSSNSSGGSSNSNALLPSSAAPSVIHYVRCLRGVAIAHIAAGSRHSAVLTVSGALFTWGFNRNGQLGIGDEKDRTYPTLVRTLRSQRIKYVCCGEDHTAVLTQDGGVFTFGAGMYGQLGHGSTHSEQLPRKVFELMGSEVTMLACGRRHTVAYVGSSGRLYTFGLGGNGQLGLGSKVNRSQPTLVQSLPMDTLTIVSVYAGGDQCFVIADRRHAKDHHQSPSSTISPSLSRDFRIWPAKSQIVTLTMDTVQQYSALCDVQKPSVELQSRIEKVFSSPSCLNASFLSEDDLHHYCNSKNHGVSIADAEQIFQIISGLKNDYIKQIIAGVLERTLIPSLVDSTPPDAEALRLFLTLPLMHYFSDPEFYVTIICPFTHALLYALDKNAAKVLESWWCVLGGNYVRKLVQIYKKVFQHILNEATTASESQCVIRRRGLHTCMEMLKRLNALVLLKVNEASASGCDGVQLIPYEEFYVSELKDKVDLRKDFVHWLNRSGHRLPFDVSVEYGKLPLAPDGSYQLYCAYAFLFDGQAKTLLLQVDALIQMQLAVQEAARLSFASMFLPIDPVNPCLMLQVNRNSLVQDTIAQLSKQNVMDLKKPLKVIFSGEEALDAGGVKKEFFLLLLKEILDPKYGMFKCFPESKLIWFNPESFETTAMYTLIGILCGLAIYNGTIIDICLPLALYRKLLKRKVTLDDLKQLQPSVGRSMQQLLDYAGEDFQEVFGIAFEMTRDVYGEVKTIELIPDGSQTSVTQQNKQQFVDIYVDYIFNVSVKEQFEAFNFGFHKVCGGHVLELFQPHELQAMVIGNENYDWHELQKNTEYKNGYSAEHQTIRLFWKVFHNDLSLEDKKKFLLFLTGSDRIPILGMEAVKMYIQPMSVGNDYLPVAHTCFNLLDLPMYSDQEKLRRKLLQAIEHTHGFALV